MPENVVVDDAMRVVVEVFAGDDVADPVGGFVVEQQAPEHRLLGLERVRRQLQRGDLRIVGHGRDANWSGAK